MIEQFLKELLILCRKHKIIGLHDDKVLHIEYRDCDGYFQRKSAVIRHTDVKEGICIGIPQESVKWVDPEGDDL